MLIEEISNSEDGALHLRELYLEKRFRRNIEEKILEVGKNFDPSEELEILEGISDKIDESAPSSLVEILLFRMNSYRFYSEANKDFLALPREMKETIVESQVT